MVISKGTMTVSISALLLVSSALAQNPKTGTYLDSNAIPAYVEKFTGSDEIERIRNLLNKGRRDEALQAALAHIAAVEKETLIQDTVPRYYAYNSLCTVYTSMGRVEEAIAACNVAMAHNPEKWSAVNNRGTAKLVGGDYSAAIADFRFALQLAPQDNNNIVATIEHNIQLAEARLSAEKAEQ